MTIFRLVVFLLVAYFAVVIACAVAGVAAGRTAVNHGTQQLETYTTNLTGEQQR